jgi:hypothetical protein
LIFDPNFCKTVFMRRPLVVMLLMLSAYPEQRRILEFRIRLEVSQPRGGAARKLRDKF